MDNKIILAALLCMTQSVGAALKITPAEISAGQAATVTVQGTGGALMIAPATLQAQRVATAPHEIEFIAPTRAVTAQGYDYRASGSLLSAGPMQWRLQETITALAGKGDLVVATLGHSGFAVFGPDAGGTPTWLGSHSRVGAARGAALNELNQALVWSDDHQARWVDLSNPSQPTVLGAVRLPKAVTAVALTSTHAWARTIDGHVYRIALNVDTPPYSNELLDFGQGVNFGGERRLAIVEDIAYVADWFSGLHLYDIRQPHAPRLLSSLHTPGSAKGVAVREGIAYIADDDHGLQVADVHDPMRPQLIAQLPLRGLAYTPKLMGDRLYMASHHGGLHIIDITDPRQPRLLGEYATPGKSWSIDVIGTTAFVADDRAGVLMIDCRDAAAPRLLASYAPGWAAEDIVVRNDLAYVTFFDAGLIILDVRDPAQPQVLSHLLTPGNARGVDVVDHYAYVADWLAGVHVIDIRDATRPQLIGSYDTRGAAWGVRVRDNYAYVGDWWGGFVVLDVRQPQTPTLATHYHARGKTRTVALRDAYAFVAQEDAGVQVFEISHPTNPTWITSVELPGSALDIALTARFACVALGEAGVALVDIANPFEARLLAHYAVPHAARVTCTDQYVYALHQGSVHVLDVRKLNTPSPRLVDAFGSGVKTWWREENVLYLVTARGVEIWQLGDGAPYPRDEYRVAQVRALTVAKGHLIVVIGEREVRVLAGSKQGWRLRHRWRMDHPITGLAAHGETLYLTENEQGITAFDVISGARRAHYPLHSPSTHLAATREALYLSGQTQLLALKLLPVWDVNSHAGRKITLTLPKNLPPGDYTLSAGDTHGQLRVKLPFGPPKMTMEALQRALEHYQTQDPVAPTDQ